MDEMSFYLSSKANELIKNIILEVFEQMDNDIRESAIRLSEGWRGRHQKLSIDATAAIPKEAVESSYRKGGLHASLTDQVSKR